MDRNFNTNKQNYNCVAPPENINKQTKRTDYNEISRSSKPFLSLKKFESGKLKDEDDYFNDDDDDNGNDEQVTLSKSSEENSDDEIDPLDAFMENINKEVLKTNTKSGKSKNDDTQPMSSKKDIKNVKGVRNDIDEEDNEESYYKYMEENPNAGIGTLLLDSDGEDQIIDYDADDNPIYKKSKYIDPLPPIDHSTISYPNFSKNFYIEHEEISKLTKLQVCDLRKKLDIKVLGVKPLNPVSSFAHFNFDEQLMKVIRKCEFSQPSPIQAQAIPIALSGRDLIGIAKTGSGKTAAFIWPMLVHIMDQPDLKPGEGPIGLILAPTRELSQQIYTETKKFSKAYNIRVVCAYGGGSKWEQQKDLEAGAEIVVATPGRLIDLVKCKATNLLRVTMLVIDEADRMFAMGFEAQVRSICDHCRPDKQTLMFSATFKKKVEKLERDVLIDPIKIIQGNLGEANQDIKQIVLLFAVGTAKWEWLISKLTEFTSAGSVLIFVTKKSNAEELATNLKARDYELEVIHGDFDQLTRNKIITKFKKKEVNILIATDVAARGLDIPHIRTVINYDVARDIDTHTHRIGRTGRAGIEGIAYTLVTEKDKEFSGHLVRNLEGANQEVPEDLMRLALQSQWFKKSRYQDSKAKKPNYKFGLGCKPGLGSNLNNKSSFSSFHSSDSKSPSSSTSISSSSKTKLEALKSAYAAQFKTAFKPASDSSLFQISSVDSNITSCEEKPKKKSRWQ